jgi:hypothetical protein
MHTQYSSFIAKSVANTPPVQYTRPTLLSHCASHPGAIKHSLAAGPVSGDLNLHRSRSLVLGPHGHRGNHDDARHRRCLNQCHRFVRPSHPTPPPGAMLASAAPAFVDSSLQRAGGIVPRLAALFRADAAHMRVWTSRHPGISPTRHARASSGRTFGRHSAVDSLASCEICRGSFFPTFTKVSF